MLPEAGSDFGVAYHATSRIRDCRKERGSAKGNHDARKVSEKREVRRQFLKDV